MLLKIARLIYIFHTRRAAQKLSRFIYRSFYLFVYFVGLSWGLFRNFYPSPLQVCNILLYRTQISKKLLMILALTTWFDNFWFYPKPPKKLR